MKRTKSNIKQIMFLLLFSFITSIFAYVPFYNYTSSIRVNDIVIGDSYVWAATKGGLMRINKNTDHVQLRTSTENFPDLNLNALCIDTEGNLWVGTKKGFLYRISPKDRHSIYTSYYSSDWEINDIYPFKKYLIIASSKGCSVFNTDEKKVLQNAIALGGFDSPIVHKITVFKDTLFLGCEEGVAKLDVSGEKLVTSNFLDKNIWITEPTEEAVISFPVYNDTLIYKNVVSAVINNRLCYAYDIIHSNGTQENYVYKDSSMWLRFYSKVTSMVDDSEEFSWFGTEEESVKKWDGTRLKTYSTGGLTFRHINRVYIAKNNTVWCIPYVIYKKIDGEYTYPWWQGVATFYNDEWTLYSPDKPSDFGSLGDGDQFLGIAEGSSGTMWFGTNGASIKKFNPENNRWDGYYIGCQNYSTFEFVYKNKKPQEWSDNKWWPGKCDAIAQDSAKYIWFTAFVCDSGSVICYDPAVERPDTSGYRYFFPKDSPYHIEIPYQLNVDVTGSIFLGSSTDEGRLIVFNHNGNPLTEGINTPILDVNKLKKVWHMVSTEDSVTWIVTGEGLFHYKFHEQSGPLLVKAENAPNNLTCIEVESNSKPYFFRDGNGNPLGIEVETILWMGTQLEGIVRVSARQVMNLNGVIDNISIDSVSYLKESDGLINNNITHMDLDKKNGYLWIATEDGLSRYNIGHSFKKLENNVNISAYPNPFVLSRHTRIVFENLAPNSSISIYTVDGRLVTNIVDKEGNVVKTGYEWNFIWKPGRDIMPGVYFYIAKREQENDLHNKRGYVGKLLILP